jgi:endonuclease/exonuclease/phosphatase (EEP) superfamily protein YafD
MLKKIVPYFFALNGIVIFLLLLIHFVFKEANLFFALLYYTFPLPIIIFIVLCFSYILKGKQRYINLVLIIILTIIWLSRSFKISAPEDIKESDIKVVFWNATHKREFKHVFNAIEKLPDVVVLVEYHAEELGIIRAKYPNMHFYWHADSEIGICSKENIHLNNVLVSEYNSTIIRFSTYNTTFYAVDVNSSLYVSRKSELAFVNKHIQDKQNTIVLGDFNLPYESEFFNTTKKDFYHAFTAKGNGFRETWFWNIPLLSLDHIWVSKDLKIITTEKMNTWKSDHSMIKTVVRK